GGSPSHRGIEPMSRSRIRSAARCTLAPGSMVSTGFMISAIRMAPSSSIAEATRVPRAIRRRVEKAAATFGEFAGVKGAPAPRHDLAVTLDVLDGTLVLLGRVATAERPEVLALAGLRILLLRVETVLARLQLANHTSPPRTSCHCEGATHMPAGHGRCCRKISCGGSSSSVWS